MTEQENKTIVERIIDKFYRNCLSVPLEPILYFYFQGKTGGNMTSEAIMATERQVIKEAFNQGNLESLSEVLAPNYVLHSNGQEDLRGVEAMKQFVSVNGAAFPDLHITLEEYVWLV
ncbi:MAG: ester cyclase [Chloroflexi bacterium]|nr:ester cyclase [Chloroflexota bacterium]